MNREVARKVVIAGAVIVTALLLVFPPWTHSFNVGRISLTRQGIHAPIYEQPDPVPLALNDDDYYVVRPHAHKFWTIQMDSRRMVNELGIVWVIAGLAFYLLRSSKRPEP